MIERIFGVTKRQFHLMVAVLEYSQEVQAKVVLALCALYNFIRVHDPDDLDDQDWWEETERQPPMLSRADLGSRVNRAEWDCATTKWEKIAHDIWDDYMLRGTSH